MSQLFWVGRDTRLAVLAVLFLAGCGGQGSFPTIPPLDDQDPGFTLLNFDQALLSGSSVARDGDSRASVADSAVGGATTSLDSFGSRIAAGKKGARGVALADQFVFVPYRSHRALVTEVISEQVDGLTISGSFTADPVDESAPQTQYLRIVGPGTDLTFDEVYTPPDRIVTQVSGFDTDDEGVRFTLKYLEETTIDFEQRQIVSREREEDRRPDGSLSYVSDGTYTASLDESGESFEGRSVSYDPDGYSVVCDAELFLADETTAIGILDCRASDGTRFIMALLGDGTVYAEIYDADGALLAILIADADDNLILLDSEGNPLLDDDGEPLVYDTEIEPPDA